MTSVSAGVPRDGRAPHAWRAAIVVIVMSLVAALALLVAPPDSARAAGTLLSQGKPATASSTENPANNPASAAVDGDAGTRWSSAFSDPQWLEVDLGQTSTITQVVLSWEAAYATAFQIQTSNDGTTWSSIYTTTTGAGGTQTLAVTGVGRYVRMYGTARATGYGYSLWEFQVYGEAGGGGCSSDDAALNHPASASSAENGGTAAAAAFDGNAGTRWSSAFSDPQWIQVDLGSSQSICQVALTWENAYATAFQIQTSNDGTNWVSIYSTTTGTGGTQTLDVSGTGRYVRMYGTARATGYGYSLWEFVVRTGGGAPTSTPTPTPTPTPTSTPTPPPGSCSADDAALNKPAAASSTQDANYYSAADAFDGDATGTRWSSAASDPQWIQVDLGSSQSVCQVVLTWEAAYGKAFQIQTSNDGTNWTSIYSTTTGTGGTQTLDVSGTGRYVRMYGTARGTGYGYSLWEFVVRTGGGGGTSSPTPPPTQTPTQPPVNWNHVWGDDFTGAANTSPSASNWITDTGTGYAGGPANWGTDEVETMTNSTANVSLDGNGHLNITALKNGGAWTSGRIETQRTDFAAPAGGQMEITATIKQPNPANGLGYWPVFRAIGAGYRGNLSAWPAVGETDIMEDVNGRSESSETLHCGTAPGGPCDEYNARTSGLSTCDGCQTGYHVYSEIIDRTTTDEQIRFYIDGQQVWIVRESQVGASAWQAAIDHGFFLTFDLAIGGSYPNAVCNCTTPSADTSSGGVLSIDSVDVYTVTGTPPAPYTTPPTPTGASTVKVTGSQGNWQLTVNGAPYYVKGLTYGPSAADAESYMPDLQSMGVNTIRTWGTDATSAPLFSSAAAHNIKVIAGFWLNQGADYVNDTAYKTSTLNTIVSWVNTYKNNPAILMWDVGNEVLLTTQDHYTGAAIEQQRDAYAQYVNQIADAIHAADPNHPVTSTDAWVGAWPYYKQYAPDLDLYALNSYGAVCGAKQAWIDGGYTKPYIITEGGPAGEWEVPNDVNGVPEQPSEVEEGEGYTTSWNCIEGHPGVALGGTEFNYGIENDFGGVWLNVTPGHWRQPGYYAIKKAYTGQDSPNTPPVISSMTVSPQTSVPAGGQFTVSVAASDPDGDRISYNLMLNSKYVDGSTAFGYANFTKTGASTFSVTAPQTLGVFKVYVYAFDGHGNVGIETRSFKVVPPAVNGTNIALGKPATASSYQAVGTGAPYPPSNVTDGDDSTRWATDWTDPQWVQVDLGQVRSFNHVQLVWESAYGKAYQIQTSNDGTNWTTIYSTTTGDGGIDDLAISGSGRYVRMYGTARGTTYGYSLYEFGIYAS